MIANVTNSSLNFKGAIPSAREAFDNKTKKLEQIAKSQSELALAKLNLKTPNKTNQSQISMQGAGQKLNVIA